MSKFKQFVDQKNAELMNMNNAELNYQTASSVGTKALTTRQPIHIHAMLNFLERQVPLTSKGELIYEAISDAFRSVFIDSDELTQLKFTIETNVMLGALVNKDTGLPLGAKEFTDLPFFDDLDLLGPQVSELYNFYLSLNIKEES